MRIGVLTGEYPPMPGGVGAHCHVLAQTLVEQGHDVFVFSNDTTRSSDPRLPLTNPVKKWRFGSLQAIKQWVDENHLDVINLHFQTAAYGMSPWIHFLPQYVRNSPIVTTFHDLRFPYLFPKAGRLRNWIVMHLARSSTGVIVTNHADLAAIRKLPCHTLIPIGSSIPTDLPADYDRQEWRTQSGATADDFLLAHFGFINWMKGIDLLLESLATLRQSGYPVKLLMIGKRANIVDKSENDYISSLDRKIESLSLTPHIHWTEFVSHQEVSAYLSAVDVVVLPFRDGASYRRSSLMAAIHHSCVIITSTPKVNIPNFIDCENMRLIRREDRQALIRVIEELYQDVQLRDTLRQGTQQLKEYFDWEKIADNHVAFFEQVIGAKLE